jgi:hypothetical protein
MVRIDSQKEMQAARKALQFCYLCGERLPQRNRQGNKGMCTEHVIPKRLLGDCPADQPQWPIALDVHAGCDAREKGQADDGMIILHRMNVLPTERWPDPKHLQRLGLRLDRIPIAPGGHGIPAIGNAQKPLSATWTWISGMHAVLYREYLPPDVPHAVLAPVPAFEASAGSAGLKEAEELSAAIRSIVGHALAKGQVDSLSAWDSQVSYECVWLRPADGDGVHVWQCAWQLAIPGVSTWSRSVLPAAEERPWHGCYTTSHLPSKATVLEIAEFGGDADR